MIRPHVATKFASFTTYNLLYFLLSLKPPNLLNLNLNEHYQVVFTRPIFCD